MSKKFVPLRQPMRFPVDGGKFVSQLEFYDLLTNRTRDLTCIAKIIEPLIVAAQLEPTELCHLIVN